MPNSKEQPPANAPQVRYLRPPALPAVMLVTAKFAGASMAPSTVDRRWIFAHTDVGDGDVVVARAEVRMQPGAASTSSLFVGETALAVLVAKLARSSSESRESHQVSTESCPIHSRNGAAMAS